MKPGCHGSVWVFGYGSLIWRADFPYLEQRPAYIRDWSRRFWQGSFDHRGVPGAPGRVVTLIEDMDACCAGMAYRIDPELAPAVMQGLDHREQGGYVQLRLPIYFNPDDTVIGTTYYASPMNPCFLGDASVTRIAEQIVASAGPSGPNTEYVLELQRALQTVIPALALETDAHVEAIATAVKHRLKG